MVQPSPLLQTTPPSGGAALLRWRSQPQRTWNCQLLSGGVGPLQAPSHSSGNGSGGDERLRSGLPATFLAHAPSLHPAGAFEKSAQAEGTVFGKHSVEPEFHVTA